MVKVKEDLTGKRFGRLIVLQQVEDYIQPNGTHMAMWECRCDCSNDKIIKVLGQNLKNGDTQSCGCYKKEYASKGLKQRIKKYNTFSDKKVDEHGEYYIGWTNNTNTEFYIDAEDFNKIKDYCWTEYCTARTHTLRAYINGKNVCMHQLLGFNEYDHADRNELNNRKYNLRQCTKLENCRNKSMQSNNTSGVIGVSWEKRHYRWRARIKTKDKELYLGEFINKEDAIIARLKAEAKYFKEFSPQRHLFEQYGITIQN